MSTVTMEELELETAELLPSRETLNCCCRSYHQPSFAFAAAAAVAVSSGHGSFAAAAAIAIAG
jgi:ApbE superfamily uncharacterized protein (UPF0280 family)